MTTPHERDRALEQWLSASWPRTDAPTDACLDAETAAAWLEGGLAGTARQQAEAHVSTCARCQALVRTIVTLESAAAAAAEPVPSRWRGWFGWMVPLGALATAGLALAVWLNVPAPSSRQADVVLEARRESARGSITSNPAVTSPAESAPSAAAPPPPAEPPPSSPPPATAAAASKAVAAPAPVPDSASGPAAAAPAPMAAPAAAPRLRADSAAGRLEAAPAVAAQQDAVANQSFAAREAAAVDVTSPDGQGRWRLAGRLVSQSRDGGTTWTPVVPGAPGRLLAGSAPSASVCWLVGERGLVLRSVDGVSFVAVTAPAPGDLVFVTASSATVAVVGTVDGRRFATEDGGAIWVLLR